MTAEHYSVPRAWRATAGGEHRTRIPKVEVITVDLPNPGKRQVIFLRDQPYIINPQSGKLERPPENDIPILKGIQFASGKSK